MVCPTSGLRVIAERYGGQYAFEPVDVLYEYDGPRLFTFLDDYGDLLLAYLFDDVQEA